MWKPQGITRMLKARFDTSGISRRLGKLFSGLGLSPNFWTVFSILPAIVGFFAVYMGNLSAALLCFFLSGAMDAVDGAVAKFTGKESKLGAFLDGVVDRYTEFILIFSIFFIVPAGITFLMPNAMWFCMLVFGSVMPSFVTAYSHHRGVLTDPVKHMQIEGLFARNERLWTLYFGIVSEIVWGDVIIWFVIFLAVLTNITALQRVYSVFSLNP